jgi:C-terminal processing protease CtpA/Prc
MNMLKKTLFVAMLVMLCFPAVAQEDADELDARMREAEQRLVEREREMDEVAQEMEMQRVEHERVMQDETIEVETRMRAAEAAMAKAAQQVAELSMRQLPRVARVERIMRGGRGPVLGVTIGADDDDGPVEGVTIRGVSPGGAAEEAGLRTGDIITSVNDESLTADNNDDANDKLLDFMEGVEEGDELSVEYLRNGKSMTTEVSPRPMRGVFAFNFDGHDFSVPPGFPVPPDVPHIENYLWFSGGSGLGDMELVMLTEDLGRYFGTDEGLLIVRAPENEELKLQDGDVILSIDSREPHSVNHAMRILGSYQSGETVNIEIMRDKRKRTISIDVPENRQSSVVPPAQPAPAALAVPGVRVAPKVKIVTAPEERI